MTDVFVLLFRDSGGDQLASRVFSSMPSSDDVRMAWVEDMGSLQDARFHIEAKGEHDYSVSIYEDGTENLDISGYLWQEALHHPLEKPTSDPKNWEAIRGPLPSISDIKEQWSIANAGKETELWSAGTLRCPPKAQLTQAEKQEYSVALAVVAIHATHLRVNGTSKDEMQSQLMNDFSSHEQSNMRARFTGMTLAPIANDGLDRLYALPVVLRERLLSAF